MMAWLFAALLALAICGVEKEVALTLDGALSEELEGVLREELRGVLSASISVRSSPL